MASPEEEEEIAAAATPRECPVCGTSLQSGASDCPDCGLSFGNPEEVPCRRCGAIVNAGWTVGCPNCGSAIGEW